MATRVQIECSTCGLPAFVRVGSKYCSTECRRARLRTGRPSGKNIGPAKPRTKQKTEETKYREAMDDIRL